MRRALEILGNLLFALGLGGLALVMIVSLGILVLRVTENRGLPAPFSGGPGNEGVSAHGTVQPSAADLAEPATPTPSSTPVPVQAATGDGEPRTAPLDDVEPIAEETATPTPPPPTPTATATSTPLPRPSPTPEPQLPITGLRIPSIGLETKVVPAKFVDDKNGGTWEVPAFVAGHADHTAGAGAMGNAVLLGHVDSIRSGDVFHALSRVAIGDVVEVWSENRQFIYRVVAIWSVPRSDGTVVQPTPSASLSLITCTGQWLPMDRDFSHRLVVRADLAR